jgi:16S rRNA (cytosine1402-N4)-methyltransferase
MASEIVEIFTEAPEGILIDATFGLGGHSAVIKKSLGSKFRIIGVDRDPEMLTMTSGPLEGVSIRKMRFSEIPEMIESEGTGPVAGVLFDLGLNSAQLDDPSRGFSFTRSGPLDLRLDRSSGQTASEMLANIDEAELVRILKTYGQERNSRAITRAIVKNKPTSTAELAAIIKGKVGPQRFIKSAARVFQALRIHLNRELDELRSALAGIIPLVATGGRLAVISYHSLEDGIVKRQFLLDSGKCFCGPNQPVCVCGKRNLLKPLSKKPLVPTPEEIDRNPRARAAKLRYAERI